MIITIAISAGIGAVIRYLLGYWNRKFPWGTLLANNLAVMSIPIFEQLSGDLETALIIGFSGALSTVSSFALEVNQLDREMKVRYALLTLITALASYELFNLWF
jgi:fluoride ion exporter CrcB/FEX